MEENQITGFSNHVWPSDMDSEVNTATTVDIDDQVVLAALPSNRAAVLVACASPVGRAGIELQCEAKKYYWRKPIPHAQRQTFVYEAVESELGFPGEAVASVSPWPDLWHRDEPAAFDKRGVYSAKFEKKVIFSKQMTFRVRELPRWKPRSIIGLRHHEEDDA